MRLVQILGAAPSVALVPPALPPGAERWGANNPRILRKKAGAAVLAGVTAWFNLHSLAHINGTYPSGVAWWRAQAGRLPVYLRDGPDESIPGSRRFPRAELQAAYSTDGAPFRYFTFSGAWMLAYAAWLRRFDVVELWGFEMLRDRQYDYERPCMAYWVQQLRARGLEIRVQDDRDYGQPGDPTTYRGPLYGYETTEPIVWTPGSSRWDGRHFPFSVLARKEERLRAGTPAPA